MGVIESAGRPSATAMRGNDESTSSTKEAARALRNPRPGGRIKTIQMHRK
jgi:hypothetical protein